MMTKLTDVSERERMAIRLDEHAVRYANDYGYCVASDLKRAAEMLRAIDKQEKQA